MATEIDLVKDTTMQSLLETIETHSTSLISAITDKNSSDEIIDARTVNGTNYSSLGDAIRTETAKANTAVSELKDSFTEETNKLLVADISPNIFNEENFQFSTNLDSDTGLTYVSSTTWGTSDYLLITPNTTYIITAHRKTGDGRALFTINHFAYYDKNKVFISGGEAYGTFTTPENAYFMRVAFYNADNTDSTYLNFRQIMIRTGEQELPYVPYYNRKYIQNSYLNIEDLNFLMMKIKYRYFVPTFSNSDAYNMILLGSNDLKHFSLLKQEGFYAPSKNTSMRDPSIIQIDDWYYFVYTTCAFDEGYEIGFCRTKNFTTFEELDNLAVTGDDYTDGNFYQVWAPSFFRDVNGDIYTVSAARRTSDGTFYTYINKYNPGTHTLEAGHNTGVANIDAHIYYEDNNYYLVCAGPDIRTSSTLTGTYTPLTGIGLDIEGYEAVFCIKKDDNTWRMFMQALRAKQDDDQARMVYVDAPTLKGTWGEIQRVTYTEEALEYSHTTLGNAHSDYMHWTVYDHNHFNGNNNTIV